MLIWWWVDWRWPGVEVLPMRRNRRIETLRFGTFDVIVRSRVFPGGPHSGQRHPRPEPLRPRHLLHFIRKQWVYLHLKWLEQHSSVESNVWYFGWIHWIGIDPELTRGTCLLSSTIRIDRLFAVWFDSIFWRVVLLIAFKCVTLCSFFSIFLYFFYFFCICAGAFRPCLHLSVFRSRNSRLWFPHSRGDDAGLWTGEMHLRHRSVQQRRQL